MVLLIVGAKGKGKTKHLLDKVNGEVKEANGNIVFIDKGMKHMHDLSNKVRLINIEDFPITNGDELIGFLCGILSQDNDLEQMYIDGFLSIANLKGQAISDTVEKIVKLSVKFKVDFVLSVSMSEKELPESARQYVSISL